MIENRPCGCNKTVENNVAPVLNNSCANENVCPCKAAATQAEMLQQIRSLAFAIQELTLYLDTHPDDEKALCLHNKYCKEYRELTDKYQKIYGPLTSQYPCNKWRWIEEPWPWEGGIN